MDKSKQKKIQDSKMPKQDAWRKDLSVSERQYNIPPNQTFAIERAFYFCLMKSCISRKRFIPSIPIPPQSGSMASFEALTEEDTDIIRQCSFNTVCMFLFISLVSYVNFSFLLGTHLIGVIVQIFDLWSLKCPNFLRYMVILCFNQNF